MSKIRILIVDDHAIVRTGLAALLGSIPDFEIVGEASNGSIAVSKAIKLNPDVIVMDLVMPKMGGVEAIQKINQEKAALLYAEIDRNPLFKGTAAVEDRSLMNVCFVMAEGYEHLQDEFMAFAKERGMTGIKGHRSVGGFRASIYNACPVESVQALVDCMKEFETLKK